MHIHLKMKTFLLRVIVTQVAQLMQTSHSGLPIQTVLLYTSLQEVLVGDDKQRYHMSVKTLRHRAFSCCFLKLYSCWWKRQMDIIISTWTHWRKDGPHCLTWQFRKCVCFWQLLCIWGTRLLLDTGTVLHDLLRKHFEMRRILSYTYISSF